MSRKTIAILVALSAVACSSTKVLLDKGAPTATIQVEVRGLRSTEGTVRFGLFAGPDGFPSDAAQMQRREILPVTGETMTWTQSDLPTGNWAVAVFHDEDGDGQMDSDLLGRPKEGWGVSNDARGRMGPPSFDDAAILLEEGSALVVVNMQY